MADPIPTTVEPLTPPAVEWVGGTLVDDGAPPPPLSDQAWVDVQATYEAVLLTLRITTSDPDAETILRSITAAASLIDQYLDRVDPLPTPTPEPVQQALEQLTVELYRRKDAPFSLLNATVPEDVSVDISGVSALQSIAPLIQPWKSRWGFA